MLQLPEPGFFDSWVSLLEATDRRCHWPMWGDDGFEGMNVCGMPALIGQPYCRLHCCEAYTNFGGEK